MRILVQFGNKGNSIIDHRMRPLAQAKNVDKILLVCRRRGPKIPKVEYHCTPKVLLKYPLISVIFEFFTMLYLSILERPGCIMGYLLFPHGLIAFVIAKLTRKPVILSLIAGPMELYAIGSSLGIDFHKPIPRLGRLFLKLLKHSTAVTTTGSFTRDFLANHGLQKDRIFPIINPANFSRCYIMQIPKKYDVVWLGRIAPVKHLEVLLYAIAKTKNKYSDIKVCVVGDGADKTKLLQIRDELNLGTNIDFMGYQKDVAYYYNSSKLFMLTSEREGFPNVFLEAVNCGLPSVVSNCGDITDLAIDGYNCIVVQDYTDIAGFANAIVRLLEDDELYHKLSRNALETAQALPVEKVAKQWEDILNTIIRSK